MRVSVVVIASCIWLVSRAVTAQEAAPQGPQDAMPPVAQLAPSAAEEPKQTTAAGIEARVSEVAIEVSSDKPLTLHVMDGSSVGVTTSAARDAAGNTITASGVTTAEHWKPLCTAPCELSLRKGVYKFALAALDETAPHGESHVVHISAPGRLTLDRTESTKPRAAYASGILMLALGTMGILGGGSNAIFADSKTARLVSAGVAGGSLALFVGGYFLVSWGEPERRTIEFRAGPAVPRVLAQH